MRRTADEINSQASLFDTEEDLRAGDEVLNSMNPPGEGLGRRVSVETYEVGVDVRL